MSCQSHVSNFLPLILHQGHLQAPVRARRAPIGVTTRAQQHHRSTATVGDGPGGAWGGPSQSTASPTSSCLTIHSTDEHMWRACCFFAGGGLLDWACDSANCQHETSLPPTPCASAVPCTPSTCGMCAAGDGLLDWACKDTTGRRGTLLSTRGCADNTWPNAPVASCPAALTGRVECGEVA